ncbi:phage terminase small subunit [Sporolactobacillus laevolacticus]|uniref:TerS protein n=1 Tax=Sporolactobacillus laevolacticus DSM 442 TaxID=1395513 RepID=V6IZ20_9BACL|nr:phage terminase small subunit [Sporolactobacillus laevolacticus]EST12056.1 TerS protein [Sporolactobacillus laevolacticus DSM 442]
MARPRDPRRDEAKDIWLKSGGKVKLVDLAKQMNVSSSTVRKWKATDKWDNELKGSAPKSKRSAPKRSNGMRGAPIGNKNAKGNSGGHAPKGNKNAVRTGEFETLMWDFLDDDEKVLIAEIPTDPLIQIDMTIRELKIRQRRMMKRIKGIEEGMTEKQRRVLQELRKVKDVHTVDQDGVEVKVPVQTHKLVVTQVEETELKKIDDILNLEEALTRVTDKLIKAIKQKQEIIKAKGEERLKFDLMQARIDQIRASTDTGANTEDKVGNLLDKLEEAFRDDSE